jgi:hypothetical protein
MNERTTYERVLDLLISRIARAFKVPPLALDMFRTANAMSGLDRKTIPTELIPLNTIQLSRGLLNFTVLQTLQDWILPFWAERQFDPADPAFIPRSHLGLSINVTHRNWTAVGSTECSVEPVVDPRGLVTPMRNGWSIDTWLRTGGECLFPSRSGELTQSLREGLPVLDTTIVHRDIRCVRTTYVSNKVLVLTADITNLSAEERLTDVAFAVRPFNPEGVSLIHDIRWEADRQAMVVNRKESVRFFQPPDRVICSNHAGGDAARSFRNADGTVSETSSSCDRRLANAFASFHLTLDGLETRRLRAEVPLDQDAGNPREADEVVQSWKTLLARGTTLQTPDPQLNSILASALSTLLMLADGGPITPGPWTYHQFWFRDAAMMVRALDLYGHHDVALQAISTFPGYQTRTGYFQSQQGEWDSNGQALWTIWQHVALTGNTTILDSLFPFMEKGARWIQEFRMESRVTGPTPSPEPWQGLLPPGLSAEHLGLADYYFWDNWWSLAGLEAFAKICRMKDRPVQATATQSGANAYREAIERAVEYARQKSGTEGIPAGPLRGVDCGMIGSCVAAYPLQLLGRTDGRTRATLEILEDRFFFRGMFLQQFIHSGLNAYLSIHVAHAWLYAGERERFWTIVRTVAAQASPTGTFPEAIHPGTGGGVMGDGHHGWAAAELALAFREAFAFDRAEENGDSPTLVLLGGVPAEWFLGIIPFSIADAPVEGGRISIHVTRSAHRSTIGIQLKAGPGFRRRPVEIRLPLVRSRVKITGADGYSSGTEDEDTVICWPGEPGEVEIVVEGGEWSSRASQVQGSGSA